MIRDPQLSDPETEQEEPKIAHIIMDSEHKTAEAKVIEAMVMGTPLIALCGKMWVPEKLAGDGKLPTCKMCIDMLGLELDSRS